MVDGVGFFPIALCFGILELAIVIRIRVFEILLCDVLKVRDVDRKGRRSVHSRSLGIS